MKVKDVFSSYFLFILLISQSYLVQAIDLLDTTFGNGNGYVATQNAQGFQINKIALDSSGNIVAVGSTFNANVQGIIARYTPTGELDPTFGSDGIVTEQIGSTLSTTVFNHVAIQTDGKIVVVGYTFDTGTATSIVIARYTTAGALDTTFNGTGIVTATFGDGSQLNAVIIQSTGEIVVAGNAIVSGIPNALIARYTSTGTLDTSFNGSGSVIAVLLGITTALNVVALDASGNIIVGGYSHTSTGNDQLILARYTAAGVLDGTFGTSGIATLQIGTRTIIHSLKLDSSGNLVVVGFALVTAEQFFVARFTSAGVLDTSFNSPNGYITFMIGNGSKATDLVIQSDGNIVVGGFINYVTDESTLGRFTSAGAFDTTFGDSGFFHIAIGNGSRVLGLGLQSDGRTVAGGSQIDPTTSQQFGLLLRANNNNTDFVNITSITSSSISTKIPTLSGTSSAASQQVRITINGTVTTTVSTDGSGNWNAGQTAVLPIGTNIIEATLLVASVPVVSHEIEITVIDTFGEDAVYAYDTTTQSLTGSFADITFNTNSQINTWSHTTGTASFTCNTSGTYQIGYCLPIVQVASPLTFSASAILTKNGTELAGSQSSLDINTGLSTTGSNLNLSNAGIFSVTATDVIRVQALGSNAQLAPAGSGTTLPSALLIITRIA